MIAKLAGAKTLVLGHYSTRYDDISLFKTEAAEVFDGTIENADDGVIFDFTK